MFFNLKRNSRFVIRIKMLKYPSALENLIATLKILPGVGNKTAERFAFHLLNWAPETLMEFSQQLASLKEKIVECPQCHCFMDNKNCRFCDLTQRDGSILCIVSSCKDVYSIEETHSYKGMYHVLGSLLSPLDGRSLEKLNIKALMERVAQLQIREIILALDSTLEGDATSLYLKEKFNKVSIPVYRLALGLPMDSPLEYVDGNTLMQAFIGRQRF